MDTINRGKEAVIIHEGHNCILYIMTSLLLARQTILYMERPQIIVKYSSNFLRSDNFLFTIFFILDTECTYMLMEKRNCAL